MPNIAATIRRVVQIAAANVVSTRVFKFFLTSGLWRHLRCLFDAAWFTLYSVVRWFERKSTSHRRNLPTLEMGTPWSHDIIAVSNAHVLFIGPAE